QGAAPSGKELITSQTESEAPIDAKTGQPQPSPLPALKNDPEAPKDEKTLHTQPSPLPALKNDLKAVLLELKQRLSAPLEGSTAAQDSKAPAAAKETVDDTALRNMQGKIEGLLKDVETFQALSKT